MGTAASLPRLVVVEGPGGSALARALELAEGAVATNFRDTDLAVFRGVEGVWPVARVDDALGATRLVPVGGTGVVVLAGFDAPAPSAADRLLVLTEAGSGLWSVVVTVADAGRLPPTLRSRAARIERVADDPAAGAAAPGFSGEPLAEAAAARPELAGQVAAVVWRSPQPVSAAVAVVELVGQLVADAPADRRPRLTRLAAAEVLGWWEQELVAEAAAGGDAGVLTGSRTAFARARTLLGLNGDPLVALASVCAKVGQCRREAPASGLLPPAGG